MPGIKPLLFTDTSSPLPSDYTEYTTSVHVPYIRRHWRSHEGRCGSTFSRNGWNGKYIKKFWQENLKKDTTGST